MKDKKKGKVFLIGAGPGDPGLITLKGVDCLEKADVIIYDYLASKMLLKHASHKSELIYVGKKGGNHTLSQESINKLILSKANIGKVVARLKGGDPFIFGRGGEEVEALIDSEIEFEIVPGVTSAIAASAYAGIPLTHRKYTSDVSFITGHEDPLKKYSNINWPFLGKGSGTLVFFMGVKNLSNIVDKLKINGRSDNTPVAIIRWGTTPKQETITGTLNTIVYKCKEKGMKPPAIIVIGDVVNLRRTMRWFDKRPLVGKKIIVTRARVQSSSLIRQLSQLGSECLEYPTIKVIDPYDWSLFDEAIDNIKEYEWLVFTSVNGINYFFKRLFKRGKDVRSIGNIKIAVIGSATADKLLKFGLKTDIIPKKYCAESLVDAFSNENILNKKIFLPRAMEARKVIPDELSKMGAIVNDIPIYRTINSKVGVDNLLYKLKNRSIDMITFTSSSTVINFKNMFINEELNLLLEGVVIASIGPITAETARKFGLKVDIVAKEYTINGLCNAILDYYL